MPLALRRSRQERHLPRGAREVRLRQQQEVQAPREPLSEGDEKASQLLHREAEAKAESAAGHWKLAFWPLTAPYKIDIFGVDDEMYQDMRRIYAIYILKA